MLTGLVGKAFACLEVSSGKTRVRVPAPSHLIRNIYIFLIYVLKEHVLASQGGGPEALPLQGRSKAALNPMGYHDMISYMISQAISYHICVYDIIYDIII